MSGNSLMHVPASIANPLGDFTGREWVFHRLSTWLQIEKPRTFLLTGAPGCGKSTLAARLVQISLEGTPAITFLPFRKNSLSFYQFCQASFETTLDPIRFIEALSKRLANQYQSFALALLQNGEQRFTINASQIVGKAEKGAEVKNVVIEKVYIGNISARNAFDWAVRKPLERLITQDFQETILILVDSLDEALTYDPNDNIVTLLRHLTGNEADLPPQVRFILTTRSDPHVSHLIGEASLDLIADAPDDVDDLREYTYKRLPMLSEPKRRAVADIVAKAGNGNFLYARYVLDDLQPSLDQNVDLSDLALPEDLRDIYRQFLRRELGKNLERWEDRYRPLLGMLAVAQGQGLTRGQLAEATGSRLSEVDSMLRACTQYLTGLMPEGPFRIYHQSFREFLSDDGEFPVYPSEANQDLARFFLQKYKGKWRDCEDDYALRYSPTHLMEALQQSAQQSVHQELAADLVTLLTNDDFLQTKAKLLGMEMVLADLRIAQDIALADDDIAKVLTFVGIYRSLKHSQSIAQRIFESVGEGNFELALQRASHYGVAPMARGRWEVILLLYLAWEAAEQGNIEATQKVIASANQLPPLRDNELRDALLVRTARALARASSDARDDRVWLTILDPESEPEQLLSAFNLAQPLDSASRQHLVEVLEQQLSDFQRRVDEGDPEAISDVPSLDEEKIGEHAGELRKLLVELAAEEEGRNGINQMLEPILTNPYQRYRDIGLVAIGVACLSVPDREWVRQRLQSILRTALDREGVTFTFDLAALLLAEGEKRKIPAQELAEYLNRAISSEDRWGTAVHARSARAAALFRRGQKAEAISELDEAARLPRGFAGYAVETTLALANRLCEFGYPESPSVKRLVDVAGSYATRVRDPQYREESIKLVETYREWSSQSVPDPGTIQDTLSATLDPITHTVYKDYIGARWAGPIDGPNLQGLKMLVPIVLPDGTALDATLGRLVGLGINQLSDSDLAEAIRLCAAHFRSGRPWELEEQQG